MAKHLAFFVAQLQGDSQSVQLGSRRGIDFDRDDC